MKSAEQKILDYAISENMIEKGDKILIGVSGGADSVCLLTWLAKVRERFCLELLGVHIHHGIRGAEADRDMQYVEKLCHENSIEFICKKYDVPGYAKEHGLSEEEAGRNLRYAAFNGIAEERGFNRIAVAHHGEDSAETILFNLIRGSRAKGLTGIAPVSGKIIRPLLCLSKKEIEDYLTELKIEWCVDSTNRSEEYSRNKIRLTILPAMKEINVQAVRHILDAGSFIGEMYDYIEREAKEGYSKLARKSEKKIVFSVEELLKTDRIIRLEIFRMAVMEAAGALKDITAAHIEAIDSVLIGQSGKETELPYNVIVRKEQTELYFYGKESKSLLSAALTDELMEIQISTEYDGEYELPGNTGRFHVRVHERKNGADYEKSVKIAENMYTKFMDCDKIKGPLLLRTRKSGDYLIVNQGRSRKKLKEYFIDNKIPISDRDKKLLLADGSHILWVLGHRMSDGCKLTAETTKQIEFKLEIYDTEEK